MIDRICPHCGKQVTTVDVQNDQTLSMWRKRSGTLKQNENGDWLLPDPEDFRIGSEEIIESDLEYRFGCCGSEMTWEQAQDWGCEFDSDYWGVFDNEATLTKEAT